MSFHIAVATLATWVFEYRAEHADHSVQFSIGYRPPGYALDNGDPADCYAEILVNTGERWFGSRSCIVFSYAGDFKQATDDAIAQINLKLLAKAAP